MDAIIQALLIIVCAIFYGASMKAADLLDEHGLKWFKGSAILFGILLGVFGALLIISDSIIANIYLAMLLAFILRYRVDYINHGIAATIMLLAFFATQKIMWEPFIAFFIIFAVFGLMQDNLENKKCPKDKIKNFFRKLIDLRFQYYLFPFLYSIFSGFWLAFFVVAANMLAYEITLRYGMKIINKQRLVLRKK